MSDDTTEDKPKRVIGKPFTKGDPRANAGGRPKQPLGLTQRAQGYTDEVLDMWIACVRDDKARWADRNVAGAHIMNRAHGMPTQQVNHDVQHGFDWKAMQAAYEAVHTLAQAEQPPVIEAEILVEPETTRKD